MFSARTDFVLAAAICGVLGLGGWVFYGLAFYSTDPSQDWMVFHSAARAFLDGNADLLRDGDRFTAFINQQFAGWLATPIELHPWLYPPPFLLLLLPFGALPFAFSYALFLVVTFAGAVAASWRFAASGRERAIHALSLLLCPAAAITVCLGQNAFLTAALLAGGFGLAARRPVLGGVLLGILTVKPQLWLLVPVALLAGRQWKALAAAAAAALVLALISLAICGIEAWRDWLDLMLRPSELYQRWLLVGRLKGQSVFAYASFLGAAPALANAIQAAFAAGAAGCVWWAFQKPMALDLRVAVLLAATMLAAPHLFEYDAVILSIAATLFFVRLLREGSRFGELTLIVLVWVCPMFPPSLFRFGVVAPLVIVLFIACVMARGRRDAAAYPPETFLSPA
jgi:hypothetical protein